MDAAPQAGVYHRYRDLSGLRGQITGDCLHRGSAADGEDSRARPAARGHGHYAGTGAGGGLSTDADSDLNRMGGWPRVVFGRRPGFGESRVTIDPPDAWFSHVQHKIGAGQGAYRPVDTCLDERIPGLYFLSTARYSSWAPRTGADSWQEPGHGMQLY